MKIRHINTNLPISSLDGSTYCIYVAFAKTCFIIIVPTFFVGKDIFDNCVIYDSDGVNSTLGTKSD